MIESVRKFALYHALLVWRTKAFWLRALLCWTIGAVILINDDLPNFGLANFDLRLQIRGPRPSSDRVLIIDVSEREWSSLHPDSRNVLRPLKEVVNLSDAFFWNPRTWEKLLSRLLSAEPSSIGIVFHFGEVGRGEQISAHARITFEDPRIVWGADVEGGERILLPTFASTYNTNVGLRGIRADDDGTVRRYSSSTSQITNLAVRIAQGTELTPDRNDMSSTARSQNLINFRGASTVFEVMNFRDILEGRVAKETLRNRIILIGSLSSPLEQMQTPLGRMSRTEVLANIADDIVAHRTIVRAPHFIYLALQTLLLAGSIWILMTYPQTVALLIYFLSAALWASASAWCFDVVHIWLPVLAPLVQLALTYIIFLSHQLSLNEQTNWRLQQEKKYLSEIEQLKTNFVSMMSHDLKTPIAKIQAICDRLLAAVPQGELASDLKTLRRSSDDLHRYIQSILQVTKVEAKDFKINKEVTDMNENIERVTARLLPLAREKKIELTTNLEPMFSIEADTTLLQEIILNLVENAIKYTPEQGRVTITSHEKDDNVEVVVEDTGPGIAAEEQEEIWLKFTRGRQQKTDIRGTGLGLYLVKYFVELHGGKVFLSSAPGLGTRIGFSIPIAESNTVPIYESSTMTIS
jgi:two-component system phosphate regulon sensor histidine kinase PhoR